MTNEEAIEIINKDIITSFAPYIEFRVAKALDMAISALSNETPEQAYNRGVADGEAKISKLHRYIQLKKETDDFWGLTRMPLIIDEQRMLVFTGWFTVEAIRAMGYEIVEVEE